MSDMRLGPMSRSVRVSQIWLVPSKNVYIVSGMEDCGMW